ncbi:MAG TPA: hypothetical protein VGM50_13805 [Gemmatimonadaceae bacterium]|jgi:hypothetical protein
MSFLRRIRGIAGVALTWAAGWTVVAYPCFVAIGSHWPFPLRLVMALKMAAYAGIAGAITGGAFATLITMRERWSSVNEFPLRRAAKWGALAGTAFTTLLVARGFSNYLEPVAVIAAASITGAVLGGATGALMLAIVQRRSLPDAVVRERADAVHSY